MAQVMFGSISKTISLELLPEAKVDDYVLVHVGVAISIVDEEEAEKTLEYLQSIQELDELNTDSTTTNSSEKSQNDAP